eukprot:24649_1
MRSMRGNLRIQKLLNQLSVFEDIESLPPDAIFFTKQRYKEDTDPRKVNLGIGAYRDDNGKPYPLKIVRKVEKEMSYDTNLNKEYLPISGDAEYVKLTQKLILGNCQRLNNGSIVGVQAISGTGSLRLLFNFIKNNFNPNCKIFISNPTWGNHKKIIKKAGLSFDTYSYWNPEKRNLNITKMLYDLNNKANRGDIILLHACAHNPTGVDPTKQEWNQIAITMLAAGLIPFFDCAYQGFATGSLDDDSYAVRLFEQKGFEFFLSQSFAKNMGLYCERAGCASIICKSSSAGKACMTQLKSIIRPMYSNPPAHGCRIVKSILCDKTNYAEWKKEMSEMSGRILEMRKQLRGKLEELKTPGKWNHITDQIGMFTFTGLTPKQVDIMINKHHIYLLSNGRISMAGVATSNVGYIANAINDVVNNY